MKLNIKILTVLFVLIASSVLLPNQVTAQQTDVSFQVFYDQLSPYGQWVDYPSHGYVWIPNAGSDFVPYSTDGHWVLTDDGWTWVSDYNWGWAPFHYGRWDYDDSYGWFWTPDYAWGPSWVTWRQANGYYGWAPMGSGVTISNSFGRSYNGHHDHWMFVRDRDIDRSNINHYFINRTDRHRILQNSTVINKTHIDNRRHATYISGPARENVQKVTGRRINPVTIRENNKPGQVLRNGQLQIYRPVVKQMNNKERKPAPSKIANLNDVKRSSVRNTTNQARTAAPVNNNNRVQQAQPRTVTQPNNNARSQQPNTQRPQNNNNRAQPAQPRAATPPNNNARSQQPNMTRPQNNNNRVQPTQPRTVTPPNNNTRSQQPNMTRPQNNNNRERTMQPRAAMPPNNNARPQQPNMARPQNNNREEHSAPAGREENNRR